MGTGLPQEYLPAVGVTRILSSLPPPTLSLSALRDTKLRGEGSFPPAFGECWGPGGGALRHQKHHPRLEGRMQSPLGVVSRIEVKEGRAWLGCLAPGASQESPKLEEEGYLHSMGGRWLRASGPGLLWAPGGGSGKVTLGCLSLRAGGMVLGVQSRKRRAQRCKGIFLHPLPPPSTCSLRR